jgi:ABC-type branched-subunit amino acid transport system substrate-binding protein
VLVGSLAGGVAGAKPKAKPKACNGTPAVVEVITNLTNSSSGFDTYPQIAAGVIAAATPVTKSCELGVPVKVVTCDDQLSPNGDAACGRDAVSNQAIAVIADTGFGDQYGPIVTAAGIPILPLAQSSATETINKLSFPVGMGLPLLIGQLKLAAAAGGHKLAIMSVDIPSVGFVVSLVTKQASMNGISSVVDIPIGPTQTDMAPFVAQAIASGADAMIPIIGPQSQAAIFKNLVQQGHTLTNFHAVGSFVTLSPKSVAPNITTDTGLLSASWSWAPSDTKNPAVKQYLSELTAAGKPHGKFDVAMPDMTGWAAMHVLADALKAKHLAPTGANAVTALTANLSASTTHYGLLPIDFTHNAFPNDPSLAKLRIFTHYSYYWKFTGKLAPVPLSPKAVDILAATPKLK